MRESPQATEVPPWTVSHQGRLQEEGRDLKLWIFSKWRWGSRERYEPKSGSGEAQDWCGPCQEGCSPRRAWGRV